MTISYLGISPAVSGALPIDGNGRTGLSRSGSVAVIDIMGHLVHRSDGGFISWLKGEGASYEEIIDLVGSAVNDRSVDQIILNIDSPGGEMDGVFAVADFIYEMRGKKPIYAVANESAMSAAYLIASAADKVYLSRTGRVGSIGVIAVHEDRSEMEGKIGVKFTEIYAGERKIDFSPHGPISKDALKRTQAFVDGVYDLFVSTVARNRGISPEMVRSTEAGFFVGSEAIEKGLADKITTITDLNGGFEMSLESSFRTLMVGNTNDEINTAMDAVGFIPKPVPFKTLGEAINAAIEGKGEDEIADALKGMGYVKESDPPSLAEVIEGADGDELAGLLSGHGYVSKDAAVENVQKILGHCELAGVTDVKFVSDLVSKGVDEEKAKELILAAKADQSSTVFSGVSATGIGDVNLLVQDAQKRAKKE